MNRFRLSREAEADLDEIWQYIAQDNLDAAERVLEELENAFRSLARMPHMGHRRTDVTKGDVLFWDVRPYVIVYQPEARPLDIVAVLHGRRNIKKVLRERA